MNRFRKRRLEYLMLLACLGLALILSGYELARGPLMLVGYLLTVAAWWAAERPALLTRRLNWPRRRPRPGSARRWHLPRCLHRPTWRH